MIRSSEAVAYWKSCRIWKYRATRDERILSRDRRRNRSGEPGCNPQSRAAGLRRYRLSVSACSEPPTFGKESFRLERGWLAGKFSFSWKIGFDHAPTNRAAGF